MCTLLIQCPECSYEHVEICVNDEQVIYVCDNCGWRKIARFPFRIGVWGVKIRQALAPVDVIQSVFTGEDIVTLLRPRLKGVSHLTSAIHNFDLGDDYFRGEINIANNVYLNQMIVLAITYAELMIRDFYRCLFYEQPKRMNPFLASDGRNKATINLNEFLQAESKEELIDRLIERSSAKASGRKVDEIISNIMKDIKLNLKYPIVENLKLLNEHRNQIIHEGKMTQIDIKQVLNGYEQLQYLLYILGETVVHYKLPFIDEIDFLYKFKQQLENVAPNDT